MATLEDMVQASIKCKAYKNEDNPDGRLSMCGEPLQYEEGTGKEFFEIPGHQREYQMKLNPSYTFSAPYRVEVAEVPEAPKKGGRPRKAAEEE